MTEGFSERIGRHLVKRALWHGHRCNWVGSVPDVPPRSTARVYRSLGPDLYNGTAGVAWFLGHLYSATGDSNFRNTSLGAVRQSLESVESVPGEKFLAFYDGGFGVAFAAIVLGKLLDDEKIEREGVRWVRRYAKGGNSASHFDLLSGTAGSIAALAIVSSMVKGSALIEHAVELAKKTLQMAQRTERGVSWPSSTKPRHPNLVGLSHGAAGIAYALLELFAITGETELRTTAELAFDYERSWFNHQLENWPDLRNAPPDTKRKSFPYLSYWCHGAAGIALTRIRAWELLQDERWKEEAAAGIRTTLAAVERGLLLSLEDFSLCHGLAGNAEVLQDASLRLNDGAAGRMAMRVAEMAENRRLWPSITVPLEECPGLFLGLAGTGYFHLRMNHGRFPSLLLLRREEFAELSRS